MRSKGFGTIEAIVAAALLSLVAAGAASTVVLARRLQSDVARERRATLLAIAAIERIRAGGSARAERDEAGFVVIESLTPCDGNSHLLEARVRVSWRDDEPRSVDLATLLTR
jgi:hypothetical protein